MENQENSTEWVVIKRLITVDGVDFDRYGGIFGVFIAKDLDGRYVLSHESDSYPEGIEKSYKFNDDVLRYDEILPDEEIMCEEHVFWCDSYKDIREMLFLSIEHNFPFANYEENLKVAQNDIPKEEPEDSLHFSLKDWEKKTQNR